MSADWPVKLHKAREMLTEQFKQEVEKELTGRETEPWEIIYFKLSKSQLPVVEHAIGPQLECWGQISPGATVWR
jgi:hypothetical protein